MNTCSMIGFFPACLFGVKKGLQVLGENCFWMLGYSELYQPALTTSAHNNLPFFWNGLQLSYAIQRRDKKVILYASRLPIFTSILPLQYLFFPNINYAFCKWLQILNSQTKMRKVAQPCFILGFFFAIQRQKHRLGICTNTRKIAPRCEALFFTGSFVKVFFPEEKVSCTEH